MKMIKNIIEYLIAISVIPAIVLTVISVTELKDVRNVQYELLSEEEGIFHVTPGTYDKLVENKKIKNYELESNYPLITQEEMERATWQVGELKNEIYIDDNGQKRIKVNVGQITLDGSEVWWSTSPNQNNEVTEYHYVILPKVINVKYTTDEYEIVNAYAPGFEASSRYRVWSIETTDEVFTINEQSDSLVVIRIRISKERLSGLTMREYLSQNPLTITYELMIKNPNKMVIEDTDLYITSDYVRMTKPNDFSNNPDGLLINDGSLSDNNIMNYIDRYEVTDNWIYVYPKDITVTELRNRLIGNTLIYELAQPRPVEVYDFSKFRLTYDKNRIRVVFDIDDEYYLWEITKDDKMIPINGQYDIGGVWTVKFYVYEIQQPLIRTFVLLIPLIVISGLLLYSYNLIKKKKENE